MFSFLTEVIGLSSADVEELKNGPSGHDILGVVRATMRREARALRTVDLVTLVTAVHCPITLLVGTRSPSWARDIADELAAATPTVEVVSLAGVGHEAIDTAAGLLVDVLDRLLGRF